MAELRDIVEAVNRLRGALDPYRAWWQDDDEVHEAWADLDSALESQPPKTMEEANPQDRR